MFSLFQVSSSTAAKMRIWISFLWLLHRSEIAADSVTGKSISHFFNLL